MAAELVPEEMKGVSDDHKALIAAFTKGADQLMRSHFESPKPLLQLAAAIELRKRTAIVWCDAKGIPYENVLVDAQTKPTDKKLPESLLLPKRKGTPYDTDILRTHELYEACEQHSLSVKGVSKQEKFTPEEIEMQIWDTGCLGTKQPRPLVDSKELLLPPHVVITHGPCPDGGSCALLIHDFFGPAIGSKIDFRVWKHGKPVNLEGLEGKRVWVGDVTAPFKLLQEKLIKAAFVWMPDHHANDGNKVLLWILTLNPRSNIHYELDESGICCGAMMVFRTLYPGKAFPDWLVAINKGDTNLIRTRTEKEKAYHAYITRPGVLKTMDLLRASVTTDVKLATEEGEKLLVQRKEDARVSASKMEWRTVQTATKMYIAGYVVAGESVRLAACADAVFDLIINKKMVKPIDFLCMRWIDEDNIKQISLRTIPGTALNVATVAQAFGGNGHPAASGVQGLDYLEK